MPSLSAAIAASASGLNAERARIEVAVSNLANSESTRSAEGTPYRRRDVVLSTDGVTPFEGTLQEAGATGVKVAAVAHPLQILRCVQGIPTALKIRPVNCFRLGSRRLARSQGPPAGVAGDRTTYRDHGGSRRRR